MAQLWGGRFTKETDKLVYNFNASISFDQKFYEQDIRGSKAHVKMLAKQGILTEKERDQILEGLEGILADVKAGRLAITSEYEDIHSFVAVSYTHLFRVAPMWMNSEWFWAISIKVLKIMEGLLKMKESIQPALARISHCARKIRKTRSLALTTRRRSLF